MSTRCNIELYDGSPDVNEENGQPYVMLYHHSDGYPDFMEGKLQRFLDKSFDILRDAGYDYWWDAERVGALMIMLSATNYKNPEPPLKFNIGTDDLVPEFQPCLRHHGDIEYLWKVYLHDEPGKYTIQYEEV